MDKWYKCRTCSKELAGTARICPHCGDVDAIYNIECEKLSKEWSSKSKQANIIINVFGGIVVVIWGIPIFIHYLSRLEENGGLLHFIFMIVIFNIIGFGFYLLKEHISDMMCKKYRKRYERMIYIKEQLEIWK